MGTIMTSKELSAFETPVLIAWARRCVERARQTVAGEVEKNSPAQRIANGNEELGKAEASLKALESHYGPAVVLPDATDEHDGTVTFSRESKANDVCSWSARAIEFVQGRGRGDQLAQARGELYADLTQNIGREG